MGGEYRLTQGNAPKWQGFACRFIGLTSDQVRQFRYYVQMNRGKIIRLTDFESRTWTGVITSPNLEIKTLQDDCSYELGFDFEGDVANTLD